MSWDFPCESLQFLENFSADKDKWLGFFFFFWDRLGPGPFAAVLQSLHLDTPLLKLQNTKKLYRTKNNWLHVQVGQILDPKIDR